MRLIEISRAGSSGAAAESGGRSVVPSRSEDNSSGDVSATGGLTPPATVIETKLKLSPEQQMSVPAFRSSEQPSDFNSKSQNLASELKSVKVSAAIHNEKLNSKDDVKFSEDMILEQTELSQKKMSSRKDQESLKSVESNKIPDFNNQLSGASCIVRNSASDNQMACTSGVSASEVAAALLGVSTSTQSINNSSISFRATNRHRRGINSQEEDLSSPYNHYRCLSPSENLNHHNHYIKTHHATGGSGLTPNRFLRRQFSLDRGDEPPVHILTGAASMSTVTLDSAASVATPRAASTGRLFKQNSAGAAHDLERIEEIPLVNTAGMASPRPGHPNVNYFRQRCELPPFSSPSLSVSVESLN